MASAKKAFFCNSCGYESPKWMGKCPSCDSWNSFIEELVQKPTAQVKSTFISKNKEKIKPVLLQEIQAGTTMKTDTGDDELNRVLGGGLVSGSLVLLGGQPGIGKSTLILQLALRYKDKVLYVTGEESEEQIKMRADRLSKVETRCHIYTETNLTNILAEAQHMQPGLLIIDSIQTVFNPLLDSSPGSISQVKECTGDLQRFAKESNVPVIIISHITKDGVIAGPKLLEHIVDVVILFEGDQNYSYRILRTMKNRFGSTDELGIYSMEADGLKEITNPSEILLSQNEDELSGIAIAASMEGLRPLLIETQALVTPSIFGTPQRSATGFDLRRLAMLLAVLEKRCGLPFGHMDVFLNLAGGIKISDPSIDLAIIASLISSLKDIHIGKNIAFTAEVGLSGEIRAVSRIEQRIQEAERLGFETIYISKYNTKGLSEKHKNIEIRWLSKLDDLLEEIFG